MQKEGSCTQNSNCKSGWGGWLSCMSSFSSGSTGLITDKHTGNEAERARPIRWPTTRTGLSWSTVRRATPWGLWAWVWRGSTRAVPTSKARVSGQHTVSPRRPHAEGRRVIPARGRQTHAFVCIVALQARSIRWGTARVRGTAGPTRWARSDGASWRSARRT